MTDRTFEVIIIGGSYAGLSAAMALGRSLRKILIIDSGLPCNRQTPHSHNFLTQDGEKPGLIAERAKRQVLNYNTVELVNGVAVTATKTVNGFAIATQGGDQYTGEKLILATGIKDLMPDIKGFAECWGISVVHCPYCHGYELRNQKTGILANGEKAAHIASLVKNLTPDVTIFTSARPDFTAEQAAKFGRNDVKIVSTQIAGIEHVKGYIRNVVFIDGSKMQLDALYAAIPFAQHSEIPLSLGCEMTEHGYVKVDSLQKTSIAGVFACGDNSGMMRSVASAVYSGNLAGAVVNKELADDAF